ncbi:MAG: TrkH family potassium uptake protein [Candidatus Thalassarchaeaceae archaeon]|jgi:trk system potassium uptake protein TrkH
MRWDVVGLVLGWTIRLVALPLLIVSLFSILDDGFSYSAKTYFLPLFISGILGQLMISLSSGYEASKRVRDREAFASVALGWIPVVLIGALPFWLGGMFYGPFELLSGDASFRQIAQGALYSWFESMSGFTTTGASVIDRSSSPICREMFEDGILNDCIGSQPKSLLLWRSLTQWFGGMGVIMLGLLIFSRALGGGKALARAELTGPTVSNLSTTLEGTARKLWAIYIVLTIIEGITLYQLTDMGGFNSLNYALTTMPSGGFGTSDLGIMAFDDPLIESIILIFMLLTCINFTLLYFGIAGRWSEVLKDEELRTYLLILSVAWIAMAFNLNRATDYTMIESIRHSLFQSVSISSTGYSSANFSEWPVFSQFVLLLLMIIGASAGSTGGGLKVLRIRIAFELAKREVMKIIQPRKVVTIRFNQNVVDEDRIWIILGMVSSWMVLVTASMLTISFLEPNLSLTDVLSVSISLLGNTGPALGSFGPVGASSVWAELSPMSMFTSTILMWLGRLELLTVLVLLHPRTWSSD